MFDGPDRVAAAHVAHALAGDPLARGRGRFDSGLFVPVGDPEGLADAVERAARLRFDGHAYVAEHFSLARMVEQTLDVYRELLPFGGRGA